MIQNQPGGVGTMTQSNFVNPMDVIMPQKDSNLVFPFGKTLTMMIDLWGESVGSSDLTYTHFMRDRVKSKVKAITTAGAAGAATDVVTFSVDPEFTFDFTLDAQPAFVDYSPGPAPSVTALPVVPTDTIMIRPASGVASNTMIFATVTSVDSGAGTFTAISQNGLVIPEVTVAEEISVLAPHLGEGGRLPDPKTFTVSKAENQMSMLGYRNRTTKTAAALGFWIDKKHTGWSIEGTDEHSQRFYALRDMQWLMGNKITNTALANWFRANNYGEIFSGQGLFPEVWDRGNNLPYSSVTGPNVQYWKSVVDVMDKQKAAKVNMAHCGIRFRSLTHDAMFDFFKEGAVTYGNFTGNQDKNVSLDWKRMEVDGYSIVLHTLEVMNDVQNLGMAGSPFPFEAMLMPDVRVGRQTGPGNNDYGFGHPVRNRYQKNKEGQNTSMDMAFWDGMRNDPEGRQFNEIRYVSTGGVELFAGNLWSWLRAA